MQGLTFELNTPHGRMMTTLLAGIAQFERDLLSERVKSGLAAERRRGKKLGRQKGQRSVSDKVAPRSFRLPKKAEVTAGSPETSRLGPVRTKASKTARRIFLYARRGSERQDFHESVIVRLMRSIVATPTLKCRAMARMDWPSLSMV